MAADREAQIRADLAAATLKVDAAQAELAAERVRAAVAAEEAKGLREALTEARRPFWQRWIG
jgi:1,4-dihydroxy-2-naphthoyl-CoA synthase